MPVPRVSAVIPTYNSGRLLIDAIESVLAQTVPVYEVIVVDDGSTDDTASRVESYRNRIRYIRKSNGGVSTARNAGVCAASGELIAFLDADDVWHPEKTRLQLQALLQFPEIGLLGTYAFHWPAKSLPNVPGRFGDCFERLPLSRLLVKNCFATSSVMVRRSAFEETGGFDPELRGPEDRDLWWRVAETWQAARIKLPLMGYREVAGSLSAQAITMERGAYRRLQKIDERGGWKGDRVLRRKAYSCHYYCCRNGYDVAGAHGRAVMCLLKSLTWYPLPYERTITEIPLVRLRALASSSLQWLRLSRRQKAPPASPITADQTGSFSSLLPYRGHDEAAAVA